MKKKIRLLVLSALFVLALAGCAQCVSAAGTQVAVGTASGLRKSGGYTYYYRPDGTQHLGWIMIGGKYHYFRQAAGKDDEPKGSMVTGFFKPYNISYYFSKKGELQTGWKKIGGKRYYFAKSGKLGQLGAMYTGKKKVGSYYYIFRKNGTVRTGWVTYKSKKYYLRISTAAGKMGRAATGWKTIDGSRYYFSKTGIMQKSRWIDRKYYVGSDGKMVTNTTVDGIEIGSDGVAEANVRVLIIAGHGMGDPGASATFVKKQYTESVYTREFADLIEESLKKSGTKLVVEMYDQAYDCYQVNRAYQANKSVIGPLPKWKDYDYVLEVHFNATVEASKDLKGDGACKGTGMYVYPGKKDIKMEKQIVAAIAKTGIPVWGRGAGVFTSNLLNARTCYAEGVSYGLLETVFIDDRDDMKFYNENKEAMAEAAASAILEFFGL